MKATLHALEYIHNRRTKFSRTCCRTPWVPSWVETCALIEILIRVHLCDCAALCGPFRKHYFNRCEICLRRASMESRNMSQDILLICCIYIFQCVYVWLYKFISTLCTVHAMIKVWYMYLVYQMTTRHHTSDYKL